MSKKHDQREKLLAELFCDDWAGGPAGGFARVAAAAARRRRHLRQTLLGASATVIIAAIFVSTGVRHAGTVAATVTPPKSAPAYEILSDDELLVALRDRPLLVVRRENGTREFVLLDR